VDDCRSTCGCDLVSVLDKDHVAKDVVHAAVLVMQLFGGKVSPAVTRGVIDGVLLLAVAIVDFHARRLLHARQERLNDAKGAAARCWRCQR
jgi:hypothetical protein